MTASWLSNNYVLTALSSAFQHTSANSLFSQTYQRTADNSLSLGTTYSSHTHGSIFTSSITGSVITNSSASNGLTLGVPAYITSAGAHTHSYAEITHIHGSGPSITGPIGVTSNSSAWSISMPSFLTTAANSTHTHGSVYATNLNATSSSSGLSLSVPVGSVYFSNVATNNITFGSITSGSSTTITAMAGGGTGGGTGGFAMQLTGNTLGSLVFVSSGTLTLGGGSNITLSQTGNRVDIIGPQGNVYFTGGSNVTWGSSVSGINTSIMLTAGGGGAGGGMGTNISTSGAITASGNSAGLSVTVPPLGYLYFGNIAGFSFVSSTNGVSTTISLSTT
jgi:hypothetical protein